LKDVDTLSEQLVRLLRDDALVESMSIAARRNIEENFELSGCTAKLEELYDSWSTNISAHAAA
jgi:hypothetical protein